MTDWKRCEQDLPPEGVRVRTISPNGREQILYRQGRLWFIADGSMYVYYVPIFWLPQPEEAPTA